MFSGFRIFHGSRCGLLGLALCGLLIGSAATTEASAPRQAAPVKLAADLACLPGGGAEITFAVRNLGRETLTIADDLHLALGAVRCGGQQPVTQLFVFPAPGLEVVRAGEERTFRVPVGDAVEPGEPTVDLGARRLLLEAEVFVEGRAQAVTRHFSFPGCAA